MHSNEIAKIAGVTVRTLRHYHKLGLLPEPPRQENGYRQYSMDDLVVLLRIRNLKDLGFSLEQIKRLLEAGEEPTTARTQEALRTLDAQLARTIEDLQARRKLIGKLLATRGDADLPPHASAYMAELRASDLPEGYIETERKGILLFNEIYDPKLVEKVFTTHHEAVQEEKGLFDSFTSEFLSLPENASEAAIRSLTEKAVHYSKTLLEKEPLAQVLPECPSNYQEEVEQYLLSNFNKAQLAVIRQAQDIISAHFDGGEENDA